LYSAVTYTKIKIKHTSDTKKVMLTWRTRYFALYFSWLTFPSQYDRLSQQQLLFFLLLVTS